MNANKKVWMVSNKKANKFRHIDNTMKIKSTELKVGDYVWNTGHLFNVGKIMVGTNRVCYVGNCAEEGDDIIGTSYDGGTYSDCAGFTIVKRDLV